MIVGRQRATPSYTHAVSSVTRINASFAVKKILKVSSKEELVSNLFHLFNDRASIVQISSRCFGKKAEQGVARTETLRRTRSQLNADHYLGRHDDPHAFPTVSQTVVVIYFPFRSYKKKRKAHNF